MSEVLKPCPFCGGAAEIWRANGERTAWIACMGRCSVLVSKEYETDAQAISAWNTRATPAADPLAEALTDVPFPDETGFYGLIGDAMREAEKAMRKFPQPNYVISKIAEEAGEVVKAAIHCAEGRETPENLRGEMKQLIAMLFRLWLEGDGVHGLPSVRVALHAIGEAG